MSSRLTHPAVVLMKLETRVECEITRIREKEDARLLKDIVLYILLFTAINEHLGHRLCPPHAAPKTCSHIGWVDVLVELVRVRDARHIQRFRGANKGPQSDPVYLSDDFWRNTVAASIPPSWNLSGNGSTKLEGFGN
jgi:hypothetical protein